jgi:hypothetical protein
MARVHVGTWNLGLQHGHDACGALASRATATSLLQGWTRARVRSLQTMRRLGVPTAFNGGFISGTWHHAGSNKEVRVGGGTYRVF